MLQNSKLIGKKDLENEVMAWFELVPILKEQISTAWEKIIQDLGLDSDDKLKIQ